MHTLIVCGTPWCGLDALFSQLQVAGVSPALPAQSGSVRLIEDWHARLFSHVPQPDQPIEPGKLWLQPVSEIFLANWDQALWGWADHRSTWLLDFWLNFDPQTRFVLVYTPAVEALATAVLNHQHSQWDTNEVLDGWCAYQAQMLQFYLRHRDRCVWLPNIHIPSVSLDDDQPVVEDERRAYSFLLPWPKPQELAMVDRDQPESSGPVSKLIRQLAQRAVQQHEQAMAIQSEIEATIPGFEVVSPAPQVSVSRDAAELLDQVRQVAIVEMASLVQRSSDESKRCADLEAALAEQAEKFTELQSDLTAERRSKADLQSRLHVETKNNADIERQRSADSQARKEIEEENELLLLQLHQVQEELENYFLKYQQAGTEVKLLQDRLARWSQRYPDHCEWSSLSVLPETSQQQQEILIKQLHYGSRSIGELTLQLRCHSGQISLVIKHTSDGDAPLLRWPKEKGADGQCVDSAEVVLPLLAQPDSSAHASWQALGPSDLQLLHAVCSNVADALPKDVRNVDTWGQLWRHAAALIKQLPPMWRYDTVRLKNAQVNPDYEHLWLSLENVQFGERHWPTFEFRLGASNVKKKGFSHLPKLEFPLPDNPAHKQFEGIFEESEDDWGAKFELRFDTKAPAMDIGSWQALSAHDQAAALALVRHLNTLLLQIEQDGASIHRPWDDWQRLVSGIQATLVTCLGIDRESLGHEAANATTV